MDATPDHPARRRPRLARELLWNLGLLGAAALSLAVGTALAAGAFPPRVALAGLGILIVADLAVLVVFGRYLVGRLVLGPVQGLMAAADRVATGDLAARAPAAETEEFSRLAERLNEMTETLLDVQSQLVRAEKLAGIGRLAAGIAHEIGNPLAALGTYLEVLRRRGAVPPDLLADLTREVDRIDRIVRPADAFQQVLVNLLLNGLDADPSGRFTLLVRPSTYVARGSLPRRRSDGDSRVAVRSTPARRPSRPDLAAGTPGVLLVVTDRGPGVPESDRERIFDPFFTTKPPGAGIGLGLALVQRSVDDMGGVVWVDDARDGGAAFKVFLPAVPA
jgi:signal transduction histidine kinase